MINYQNVIAATFKQTMRHLVPGVILAFGVGVAGAALAQTVAPEVAPEVAPATIPLMTLEDTRGHTGMEPNTTAPTTAAPAPRMTWDSIAPELDTFGNETVPVFTATSPTR
jgi:hypothetical protein